MGLGGTCAVEERMRFVMAVKEGQEPFAAMCRRFGASRKSGYKWLERYEELGVEGLSDRSRAPHHHPHAIAEQIVEQCLAVRRAHPSWGPLKVRAYLERQHPSEDWPVASTIGALFDREGLTVKRKLRRRSPPSSAPFAHCGAANDVWCIDFKGWFSDWRRQPLRTADAQRRLQPLSVALPGAGTHRHRSCLAGARCSVPRVRAAASSALRQRLAICLARRGRAVEAVGEGDQGRRHRRSALRRASRSRTAGSSGCI